MLNTETNNNIKLFVPRPPVVGNSLALLYTVFSTTSLLFLITNFCVVPSTIYLAGAVTSLKKYVPFNNVDDTALPSLSVVKVSNTFPSESNTWNSTP